MDEYLLNSDDPVDLSCSRLLYYIFFSNMQYCVKYHATLTAFTYFYTAVVPGSFSAFIGSTGDVMFPHKISG